MALILASTSPIRRAHARRRRGSHSRSRRRRRRGRRSSSAHDGDGRAWRSRLPRPRRCRSARAAGRLGHRQRFSLVTRRRRAVSTSRATAPRPRRICASFSGRPMHPVERGRAGARRRGRLEPCRKRDAPCPRLCRDAFIDAYLDAEWPEVGYCVGVFRMEGRGVTLFDRVEGEHFTILGMPLLPLLGALRERGNDGGMTSSTRPFAEVIGDPIAHSRSPVIHDFWLDALGIDADYRRRLVTRAELARLSSRAPRRSRLARVAMSPCRSSSTRSTSPRKRPTARSRPAPPTCCCRATANCSPPIPTSARSRRWSIASARPGAASAA